MLLGALHLRTSKLFSLRAKRKFYNCSPFLGQNGRKTATTTAPPAKLAPTHAPARPPRALVGAWGRCAPILATPLLPQCHKQRPKRGVVTGYKLLLLGWPAHWHSATGSSLHNYTYIQCGAMHTHLPRVIKHPDRP